MMTPLPEKRFSHGSNQPDEGRQSPNYSDITDVLTRRTVINSPFESYDFNKHIWEILLRTKLILCDPLKKCLQDVKDSIFEILFTTQSVKRLLSSKMFGGVKWLSTNSRLKPK